MHIEWWSFVLGFLVCRAVAFLRFEWKRSMKITKPSCRECGAVLTWYEQHVASGVCDLHWE